MSRGNIFYSINAFRSSRAFSEFMFVDTGKCYTLDEDYQTCCNEELPRWLDLIQWWFEVLRQHGVDMQEFVRMEASIRA